MKSKIMYGILIIVCPIMLFTALLYGIDRESARNDYLKGKEANNCIFQSNCDYYNDMEIRDDTIG